MHQTGLSPPPQMQQHQTYYSTPSYTNMPTIPSPPAVVYPQQAAYNPYGNMEAARAAQLAYGYPTGGANNSMSFNAFMQQPNLASAPTHEMYPNLSQYRAAVQPFNQNNPLLISSATAQQQKPQNSQIGAIGSKSSSSSASGQYNQQYMNHVYHHQQNSYYTNSTAQQANPYYSGPPTGTGGATTGNYGMFASQNNGPPPPQQMANFGSVGQQFPLGSQMLNSLVINQQYRSGPVVNAGSGGNGNASGGNSNAPGAGGNYMKQQQQHQSQLQDPVSSTTFFKNV
jgi:hypothetical protein